MTSPTHVRESDRLSIESVHCETTSLSFGEAVEAGLSAPHKWLPCRFFYDERGSLLFEEICDLPEYYPTRVEREILEDCADEITQQLPAPVELVELGSGSAAKTRTVIEALLGRHGDLVFTPIDISRSILEASSRDLLADYGSLEIQAIEAEYELGLAHLRSRNDNDSDGTAHLILWLGSSIGNLTRKEATSFLRGVHESMRTCDRLLVGIDLRKDPRVLERAYDDVQGVTADFNLNLLSRINRELGGAFELEHFEHRAHYNDLEGRVEMHLVSLRDQRVAIDELGREFSFAANETIHTENSYKYSAAEIDEMAGKAGLRLVRRWADPHALFSVNLFEGTAG